jgi:hypothetical protein
VDRQQPTKEKYGYRVRFSSPLAQKVSKDIVGQGSVKVWGNEDFAFVLSCYANLALSWSGCDRGYGYIVFADDDFFAL